MAVAAPRSRPRPLRCPSIRSGRPGPAPARSRRARWRPRTPTAVDARLKALGLYAGQGQEEADGAQHQAPGVRGGVTGEGHRHLHPPVRDDDRRRPAAGAVPRHPRAARRTTRPSARCSSTIKAKVERARPSPTRSKEHPKVFDELYVQPRRRRRGRRHPRHHPQPPRDLHREGEKLKRKVKGAMIYPIVVLVRRHRRDRAAAPQGHPGLREDVHGLRRRAAGARPSSSSTSRNWLQALHPLHRRRHRRRRRRLHARSTANPKGREIFDKRHPQGADHRAA